MATAKWAAKQQDNLLPCRYFHLVFILPHELNIIAQYNPKLLYQCLFQSVWQALGKFAKRKEHAHLGAELESAYSPSLLNTRRCFS